MMKCPKSLLPALAAGALLFAGTLLAQDVPPPTSPAPAESTMTAPEPMPAASGAATAAQGQVTVQSAPAPAPVIGPAPSFEQLSGGAKSISEEQAMAYPPLANDFLHASNNGKRVSKSQYEKWVKQL